MSLAPVKLPPPGLPDNPVPEPAGMASLKARGYPADEHVEGSWPSAISTPRA